MVELTSACIGICIFLLTYLLCSTLSIALTHAVLDRSNWVTHPELRVLVWKLALTLPVISTLAISLFDLPHVGVQFPIQ